MKPATVRVDLGARAYDIVIGSGVLEGAAPQLAGRRVFVVTDEKVGALYLDRAEKFLRRSGAEVGPSLTLPAGESEKNILSVQKIVDHLLNHNLDRKCLVAALGGGVIGDMAGFAAAIALRGIDFIQIPTTLLAQVDSSVGGKTGVNVAQGKNLVGAFHQPVGVFIDTDVLQSLDRREFLSGYAEVLKYALINDPDFFDWLDAHEMTGEALTEAIRKSCAAKAAIVAADEKEQGQRALLNLGHTFGHAIEGIGGYDGRVLHGEAVAIGLWLAFRFSEKLGLCPAEDVRRIEAHYGKRGLPMTAPFALSAAAMLSYMKRDKKAENGHITLILAKGIGKAFKETAVPETDLVQFMTEVLE